jgi:hypothetical protein
MKNQQPSLMVHTNPEFETSNLILDFEFDHHLGSHKHVINIIMRFRDMGCYTEAHQATTYSIAAVEASQIEGEIISDQGASSHIQKAQTPQQIIGNLNERVTRSSR